MLINQTFEIDSCDDVELGIKRTSRLEYRISYDDEKEIEAIVFIIQGVGADISSPYLNFDMQYFAKNYNYAMVSVDYHCIGNRPQTGSVFYLDDFDKTLLANTLKAINFEIPIDIFSIDSYDMLNATMKYIDHHLSMFKQQGYFSQDFYINLHVSLQPKKDEYQNFGIMQAQDIVNVALNILHNPPNGMKLNDKPNVIVLGDSLGGYLSNLCAKIAPWLIDGVVDNSSNALMQWRYNGTGKEIDFLKYSEFDTFDFFKNIRIFYSTKTHWTTNENSKYYFGNSRKLIRNILNKEHLKIQALYSNTEYIFYHSAYDQLASYEMKKELVNFLKDMKFDVYFREIVDQKQIDNKFIKTLDHGMGIPNKLLIKKEIPLMLERIKSKKSYDLLDKTISYPCEDLIYIFYEENNKINLKIKENNAHKPNL